MIDYMRLGVMPDKNHIAFRRESDGMLYHEHCFTRAGFSRTYSILYHRVPPTRELGTFNSAYDGTAFCVQEKANNENNHPLRRRHLDTNKLESSGNFFQSRKCIVHNQDIRLSIAKPTEPMEEFFANGDGDELYFFHKGSGWAETQFGRISFKEQDYLLIPRGCIYRLHFDEGEVFAVIMEGLANIEIPDSYRNAEGQLDLFAPYCHRDFGKPEALMVDATEYLPKPPEKGYTVITKRHDRLSDHHYGHYPLDAAGWDGFVYPITFPIKNFQAKAALVHPPPTVHTTFSSWAEGADLAYVICSFVPRNLDFHPQGIPCPYNHSSPNADEILFYVEGNFISRKGIGPGSISLHPTGMPHGPHPGAYEASIGAERTEELAVMIDTFHPLLLTNAGKEIEVEDYNESWIDLPLDHGKA